jgi:hypothetical protein
MSVVNYINRAASDPEISDLLNSLGQVRPDEFGGLTIFDYPESGVSVYFDEDNKIRTIFLYSDGRDGHKQSVLQLPHDVTFLDSLEAVVRKIGRPQVMGVTKSGMQSARYDYGSHALHLEFAPGDRGISLARVMVAV